MSRYQRCTSCRMVLDAVTHTMVLEGITAQNKTAGHYAKALAESEPFVCEACKFVAAHTPHSTPPDPSTYEKLGR